MSLFCLRRVISERSRCRVESTREARAKADEILAEARERAASLRTEGLKEVGELQEHVEQLLGLRSGLTATLKRTMEEVGGVLDRLAGRGDKREVSAPEPGAPAPSPPDEGLDLGSALSPFSADSEG